MRFVKRDQLEAAIADDVAVVMLTEVDYRTGERLEMKSLTERAHAVGALTIWDLAHSAGAFPVELNALVPRRLYGSTRAMPTASGSRWQAGSGTLRRLRLTRATRLTRGCGASPLVRPLCWA